MVHTRPLLVPRQGNLTICGLAKTHYMDLQNMISTLDWSLVLSDTAKAFIPTQFSWDNSAYSAPSWAVQTSNSEFRVNSNRTISSGMIRTSLLEIVTVNWRSSFPITWRASSLACCSRIWTAIARNAKQWYLNWIVPTSVILWGPHEIVTTASSRRLHHIGSGHLSRCRLYLWLIKGWRRQVAHPHSPESLKSWLIEAPGARIGDTDMVIRVVAPSVCVCVCKHESSVAICIWLITEGSRSLNKTSVLKSQFFKDQE